MAGTVAPAKNPTVPLAEFINKWAVRGRGHARRMGLAYLILLLSLIPAVVVFMRVRENLARRDEERLAAAVDHTRERIERRFARTEAILKGVRGLFLASGTVRPDEWNLFLESLSFSDSSPGFRDLGFAYRVPASELARHVQLVTQEVRSDYKILPPGDRPEYFPIIYLRDGDMGDVRGLGWDPYANETRRQAMDMARDNASAVCSEAIAMALPGGTSAMRGHVVYLPVYRGSVQPHTIEERREKLVGFVFASFVPDQLWASMLKPEAGRDLHIEIFEGAAGTTLAYKTRPGNPPDMDLRMMLTIRPFGKPWTLCASALPAFEDPSSRYILGGVAFGGIAISLTLFSLGRLLVRGRVAAESMATTLRRSQQALRDSETRFRQLTENARDVIYRYRLGPNPGFEYLSPAVARFSSHPPEDFYQDPALIFRLAHPDDRQFLDFQPPYERLFSGPVTLRFVNDDGSILWLEARNVPVKSENGRIIAFEGVARDISESKSIEEATRRSEERLGRILETIADGVLILDPAGRITYANAAAEDLLAPDSTGTFRGKLRDHPESIDPAIASLAQLLRFSARRHAFNYTYRRKDGVTMFLAINAAQFSNADGEEPGVVASIRDVTAEKRAEQALMQSQTRLRILNNILGLMAAGADVMQIAVRTVSELARHFSNYRVSFSIANSQGQWAVVCSEGTAALKGVKGSVFQLPSELEDSLKSGHAVVVPDTARFRSFSAAVEQGPFLGVRAILKQPVRHGSRVEAALSFHSTIPREWSQAETVMLLEVADYLSAAYAQFDVAESRREAEAALLAEKERLAVTLRSIADGVITTDTEGRVALLNHAAEALTGWSQKEAEGRPIAQIFQIRDEKSGQALPNPAERVLCDSTRGESSPGVILVSREGETRVVSESAAQIRDHRSRLIGAVLVFRDITEKRQLETELLKASKLESVGLLAGGIAHDFNNILTVVLGNITLSKMLSAPVGPLQERLTRAEKGCLRARELTQQLLTFAKGGSPIRKAASIVEIVRDATAFAISGSNVVSKTHAPADLWPAEVDEGQISQVFNNLVINAVQAMPDGGTLRVTMENLDGPPAHARAPLAPGRYVHIAVQDSGVGIAPDHLPRIFDPYFSTKKGGNGLGLATCYAIVQKHQGAITLESRVGVGTTFHVYLPASEKPVAPKSPEQEMGFAGQGRILVMDDEPDILDLAGASLRHLGYEPDTATNGKEAIEKYMNARNSGHPYDLVIMDLTIPGGMGGKEAMKRLRELDPSIRAIVSSGYSQDPVMADYRKYGFAGVVEKPYQIRALARTLSEILSEAQRS